jgi:hypothetical protein
MFIKNTFFSAKTHFLLQLCYCRFAFIFKTLFFDSTRWAAVIIIIIIGSTALGGPWPPLEDP